MSGPDETDATAVAAIGAPSAAAAAAPRADWLLVAAGLAEIGRAHV